MYNFINDTVLKALYLDEKLYDNIFFVYKTISLWNI